MAVVSPAWLTLSNWTILICSILLIWEASRLASITIASASNQSQDHGLLGNRVVPTVHWPLVCLRLHHHASPPEVSGRVTPPASIRGGRRHTPRATDSSRSCCPCHSPSCYQNTSTAPLEARLKRTQNHCFTNFTHDIPRPQSNIESVLPGVLAVAPPKHLPRLSRAI